MFGEMMSVNIVSVRCFQPVEIGSVRCCQLTLSEDFWRDDISENLLF